MSIEFAPKPKRAAPTIDLAPIVDSLREQLQEGMESATIDKLVESFTGEMRQLVMRFANPNISVGAPHVTVEAPNVQVDGPTITVTPDIMLAGLEGLVGQLNDLLTLQRGALNELSKPITTSIKRDADGRIIETIQRRG